MHARKTRKNGNGLEPRQPARTEANVSVNVPTQDKEALQELADASGVSLSHFVRAVLHHAIMRRGRVRYEPVVDFDTVEAGEEQAEVMVR